MEKSDDPNAPESAQAEPLVRFNFSAHDIMPEPPNPGDEEQEPGWLGAASLTAGEVLAKCNQWQDVVGDRLHDLPCMSDSDWHELSETIRVLAAGKDMDVSSFMEFEGKLILYGYSQEKSFLDKVRLAGVLVRRLAAAAKYEISAQMRTLSATATSSVIASPPDDDPTGATEIAEPENGGDTIKELESKTPAFDCDSALWVRNKLAAKLEGLETDTLKTYRYAGEKNTDKTFGRDPDGRIWRRPGMPNTHPWYLRSTLTNERRNRG